MKSFIKISLFVLLLSYLCGCGFKPMYKFSENSTDFGNYSIVIMNEQNVSREIKEEIRKSFPSSKSVSNYLIEVSVNQNLDPLITNTDGTVSKYRIEIIINFNVKNIDKNVYLVEDVVRGFAQYTVETSEIESDDKKKRMIRTATSSAIQMMISRIQSAILIVDDN